MHARVLTDIAKISLAQCVHIVDMNYSYSGPAFHFCYLNNVFKSLYYLQYLSTQRNKYVFTDGLTPH